MSILLQWHLFDLNVVHQKRVSFLFSDVCTIAAAEKKHSLTWCRNDLVWFLPERMFGTLLSQIRLSSVTFVRPTQAVETFGNISSPICTVAILWTPCKILRRSSQGTPPSDTLNARGAAKWSDASHSPDEFLVLSSDNASSLSTRQGVKSEMPNYRRREPGAKGVDGWGMGWECPSSAD